LKSRSFRRGWNQIAATPWDLALYFSPRKASELAELYLDARPENRRSKTRTVNLPEGYHEIVSFCSSVELSTRRDGSHALIRNFLCFTVPRTGVTKTWEAYKSIDHFPVVPLSVYELKAKNDTQNEKDGFGANYGFRVLVNTSDKTAPYPRAVYFNQVLNHDAALKYVEKLQQNAKGLPKEMGMHPVEAADGAWLVQETDEYARREVTERIVSKDLYQALTSDQVDRLMEYVRQTRYLNSQWDIHGYAGSITDLLENRESDCADYGEFIQQKLRELAVRTRPLSKPFSVEAYSPLSYTFLWMVHSYIWPSKFSQVDDEPTPSNEVLGTFSQRFGAFFAYRYGTQLWAYSQSDSVMQIDIQVFQAPAFLFPDAVRKYGDEIFRRGYGQ
jgi:hypothetical protein